MKFYTNHSLRKATSIHIAPVVHWLVHISSIQTIYEETVSQYLAELRKLAVPFANTPLSCLQLCSEMYLLVAYMKDKF